MYKMTLNRSEFPTNDDNMLVLQVTLGEYSKLYADAVVPLNATTEAKEAMYESLEDAIRMYVNKSSTLRHLRETLPTE